MSSESIFHGSEESQVGNLLLRCAYLIIDFIDQFHQIDRYYRSTNICIGFLGETRIRR